MILTVFRSRLRDPAESGDDSYPETAARMSGMARGMPGYLSHKSFTAEDGERVNIVEFADMDSHRAWATHAHHVAAKQQGRASYYASYSLQVCEVLRESKFVATASGEGPAVG